MVFFAYDVTNGNNYSGKTVKLGTSLDFNSTKSYVDPLRTDYGKYGYNGELKTLLTSGEGFKTIGITTEDNKEKNLSGTFDGNNNFIKNLYINVTSDAEFEKRGLFANNYGTINNLKLLDVNLYLNNKLADIYCHSYYGDDTGILQIGGIFNSSGTDAEIINCYNKGNVTAINDNEGVLVGGIGGNGRGIINNCYNTGNIYGKSGEILRIGGILGTLAGSIKNCYSTGEVGILEGNNSETTTIGMVLGRIFTGSKLAENLYYQKIDETLGIGINVTEIVIEETNMQKTEEEMKQDSFVELLNNGESNWKKDTNNINNGYPILYWE